MTANKKILSSLAFMKEFTASEKKKLKAIGKRLRELRIENGYTGYDHFAWEHDLARSNYFKMEQGINCKMLSLLKILEIHGVTLEEFARDAGL